MTTNLLLTRLLLVFCAAAAVATMAHAADPAPPRPIEWHELMPKGWDPMKDFKGIDLGQLDDSDPRANELLMKMQEIANNAPINAQMNGVVVKLAGYVVPLEENKGEVTEFLLVPSFGACIHTPPPPANQVIHVRPRQAAKLRTMDTVWITGKLQAMRGDSMMGVSGYHMTADSVTRYTGAAK